MGQNKGAFFELGGTGGIASINYEKMVFKKGITALGIRAGFSTFKVDRNSGWTLIFPVLPEVIVGNGKHRFEASIGQTFSITTKGAPFFLMPATIGYRFVPEEKKIYYRIAYTPMMAYLFDFQYQHWGGFSIGYRFN